MSLFRRTINTVVMSSRSFYGVARGRNVGVFHTWAECKLQVDGFKSPLYRKFPTLKEAQEFVNLNSDNKLQLGHDTKDESFSPSPPQKRQFNSTFPFKAKKESNTSKNSSQNATSSRSSIVEELKSIKTSNLQLKEKITNFMLEQQNLINSMNHKIDGVLELIGAHDATDEELLAAVPPLAKRPHVETASSNAVSTTFSSSISKNEDDGFRRDDNGFVIVYTDGACENNGKAGAKAGYGVYWADGHPLNRGEPASRATNNVGEIEAITESVKIAHDQGVTKLKIYTDSMFVINCMTQWISGWKKNGWKKSTGDPVKNRVELEALDKAITNSGMNIIWEHVRGHVGIHGNEMADALARQGAQKFQ